MAASSTFIDRFIAGILRVRTLLLILALIVLCISGKISQSLEFDEKIESLYAQEDPHLQKFLESKALFGGDEFLMVAWRIPHLFKPDAFELTEEADTEIRSMAEKLNQVPGINPVSTQTLADSLKFPFGRKKVLKLLEGVLVDDEHEITAILVRLAPETNSEKRAQTFEDVVAIAEAHDPPAYVAGEPIHIHDMFQFIKDDGTILFRFSFVLLGIVLLILFRSIRWLILPALIVAFAVTSTQAILVLCEVRLSMVSAVMNSLVTIIGVATMMHLAVHYREHRSTCSPEDALRFSFQELLRPIFWTCATTAAGFLALMSSEITPVKSFGIMMSLATMLVFVAVILIVPAGILLITRFQNDPGQAPAEKQLSDLLEYNARFVGRYPKGILLLLFIGTCVAGWGFRFLEVETNFAKNFRSGSRLVQALEFVEYEIGGSTTLEVNFPAPETLSEKFIDRVAALSRDLREMEDESGRYFTTVTSMDEGLKIVPSLPFISNTPRKKLNRINALQPEYESTLYNADEKRMRIFLRTLEQQDAERKNRIIDETTEIAQQHFPEAKVSGLFVLLTFLIDSLMSDQLVSFAWAAAGIFLLMTIAFRSPILGFVGIVPNIFPIVMVIGGMGWAGVPINIGTAMITCVSMGLTVDSSIHYLSSFQREMKQGHCVAVALANTSQNVGRALVFANLALVAGLSVLTVSQFIPLVYFGALVSLAMIGGLVGNLILLPLMLTLIYRGSLEEPFLSNENSAASETP